MLEKSDNYRFFNYLNRWTSYIPLLVLTTYSVICLLLLVDSEWHQWWDSGIYLLTARNLANGMGYIYLDQPFFLRPPGFSYFLSWIISPTGDFDFYKLNFIIMLLGMGSLAAAYVLIRRYHGKMWATGITLLLGTSPRFVRQFNWIMSDFLFLFLFFFGIWFILPPKDDSQNPIWRGLIGAVLISGSIYVRSVGFVLIPGIIALGFLKETGIRKLVSVAQVIVILVILMPWISYSRQAAEKAPKPATQGWNFSYSTALLHIDPGDPTSPYVKPRDWAKRILSNTYQLVREIGKNIPHSTNPILASIVAVFIGTGFFLACLRGWSILEYVSISYACIIISYYVFSGRLVLPMVLLFYHYLVIFICYIVTWCESRYRKKYLNITVCLAVFAILISLNIIGMTKYTNREYKAGLIKNIWKTEKIAAEWIKANTEKDDVILHESAPTIAVLTNRRVYSYKFLYKQPLPKIDYALITGKPTYFEPELKSRSIGSWILPGDPKVGNIRIYRVH